MPYFMIGVMHCLDKCLPGTFIHAVTPVHSLSKCCWMSHCASDTALGGGGPFVKRVGKASVFAEFTV
jgi:hypothetical protein